MNASPVSASKPYVKKIAGGSKTLLSDKDGVKQKSPEKMKKEKKVKKIGGADQTMEHLHSSYGSLGLNNSLNSLNLSASSLTSDEETEFATPPQQSPWKVKLKKTPVTSSMKQISAPPLSPSSVLKPVKKVKSKRNYGDFDYSKGCANSLLEEFSTPRQSPWKSPTKKKVTMSQAASTPMLSPSEDPSESSEIGTKKKKKKKEKTSTISSAPKVTLPKQSRRASLGGSTTKKLLVEDPSESSEVSRKEKKKKKKERRASIGATVQVIDPSKGEFAQKVSSGILKKKAKLDGGKKAAKGRKVKFTAFRKTYTNKDVRAATRIQALARGKRGRTQAKYLTLQRKLANMDKETKAEIKKIKKQTVEAKKEFKERAYERAKKNLDRKGKEDAQIDENNKIISTMRNENADIRARNIKLYQSIENLKINNKRLEDSNSQGGDYLYSLKYHDETCEVENKKLLKFAEKYKKAVDEHTEHLELHTAYGDAEHNIKSLYSRLLAGILNALKNGDNEELLAEIHAMAAELPKDESKVG